MFKSIFAVAGIAATIAFAAEYAVAASFEMLFPVDVPYGTKIVQVSDDGAVALSLGVNNAHDTYIWKLGKGITSQFPRTDTTHRNGLSGDGKTILSCAYPSTACGFDASYDGKTIAGVAGQSFAQAYRATNSEFQLLGFLPDRETSSRANAISADGNTVVGVSFGGFNIYSAFRWTAAEGMTPLGTLPGYDNATAIDVSGNGEVVVGTSVTSPNLEEAFRWTKAAGMQSLGDLPGRDYLSIPAAISADGITIVGTSRGYRGYEAFIWDETHGMRNLADLLTDELKVDLKGLSLQGATGVSADGNVIVGWGYDANNNTVGWRADLVPEPVSMSLWVLMGGACVHLSGRLRWRPRRWN